MFSEVILNNQIKDMHRIADVFCFSYRNMKNDIKIDIYEYENGYYMGVCSDNITIKA